MLIATIVTILSITLGYFVFRKYVNVCSMETSKKSIAILYFFATLSMLGVNYYLIDKTLSGYIHYYYIKESVETTQKKIIRASNSQEYDKLEIYTKEAKAINYELVLYQLVNYFCWYRGLFIHDGIDDIELIEIPERKIRT